MGIEGNENETKQEAKRNTHIYVRIYIHTFIHIYIYVYMYKYIDIHIHSIGYMYTCMYIYICIHTYIYVYIHILCAASGGRLAASARPPGPALGPASWGRRGRLAAWPPDLARQPPPGRQDTEITCLT